MINDIDNIFNSVDIIESDVKCEDIRCSIDGKRYMFYVCSYYPLSYITKNSDAFHLWEKQLIRRLDVAHEITAHSKVAFLKTGGYIVPDALDTWLYGKFSLKKLHSVNPYFFGIDVKCRNERDTYIIIWHLYKAMHCCSEFWIIEPREGYGDAIYFQDIRINTVTAKYYRALLKGGDLEKYGLSRECSKIVLSSKYVERFLNKEMYRHDMQFIRRDYK